MVQGSQLHWAHLVACWCFHWAHLCFSRVSVRPAESFLRMKEETAEVDEFTFSQGASDQESNGSGSYYIKQEHWGGLEGARTHTWGNPIRDQESHHKLPVELVQEVEGWSDQSCRDRLSEPSRPAAAVPTVALGLTGLGIFSAINFQLSSLIQTADLQEALRQRRNWFWATRRPETVTCIYWAGSSVCFLLQQKTGGEPGPFHYSTWNNIVRWFIFVSFFYYLKMWVLFSGLKVLLQFTCLVAAWETWRVSFCNIPTMSGDQRKQDYTSTDLGTVQSCSPSLPVCFCSCIRSSWTGQQLFHWAQLNVSVEETFLCSLNNSDSAANQKVQIIIYIFVK